MDENKKSKTAEILEQLSAGVQSVIIPGDQPVR